MGRHIGTKIVRKCWTKGLFVCIWSIGTCALGIVFIEVYQVSPDIAYIATFAILTPAIYKTYQIGEDLLEIILSEIFVGKDDSSDDKPGQTKETQSNNINSLYSVAEKKIVYLLVYLKPRTKIPRNVLKKCSPTFKFGIEIRMVSRRKDNWLRLKKYSDLLKFSNDTVSLKSDLKDDLEKMVPKAQRDFWKENADIVRKYL